MHRSSQIAGLLGAMAAALIQSSQAADAVNVAPVTLSPSLMKRMHDSFGDREIPALQKLVADAVHKQMGSGACGKAANIQIQIEDATPTHPTRWQMENDPSLDFLYSKSVGGAELTGRLLGADGRALTTSPTGALRPISTAFRWPPILGPTHRSRWIDLHLSSSAHAAHKRRLAVPASASG